MVSQSNKLTAAGHCLLLQPDFQICKRKNVARERRRNMVKLRLVCDSFHNFIEYMFFVVSDG